MNRICHLTAVAGICACLVSQRAHSQSAFQNLDFESATLSPTPPNQNGVTVGGFVPVADALPGWTVYEGASLTTQVYQNNFSAGSASVDILGPNFYGGGASPVIQGNYTVDLQPGLGYNGTGFGYVGVSISQTGLVPANSESLQFKASSYGGLFVSLGGQNLNLIQLGTGPNYTLYGANISQFSGQSEILTISTDSNVIDGGYIDSFVFSPTPVPEPSVIAIAMIGGVSVLARIRKK